MKSIATDSESGAEIFQLTEGGRPADNIYGEQPYASATGERIAVRFYETDDEEGGLSVLDLSDGSTRTVVRGTPRFPAFHAWGDFLFYQEETSKGLSLKRCSFETLEREELTVLPVDRGRFSYGTVSGDRRYYAASVHREGGACEVFLIDLVEGVSRVLAESDSQLFKHEQFSLDGRNRVLIQANALPDVEEVHLGVLDVNGESFDWLPVDRPHTPRPTGHEAWIGRDDRVFLSTATDEHSKGNLWTAASDDAEPQLVVETDLRFSHVSVSRCGRYWVGDATREAEVPIYVGSFETGRYMPLVRSGTVHDGGQWSHTHPYLTADSRWLIYTSNRSGQPQVHGARIPAEFLRQL